MTQIAPPRGIPFVPSQSAVNETLVRSFTRAGAALVEAKGNKQQAARLVSDDRGAVEIINRTATTPASTALTTFKQTTIAYMASILSGASALRAIIERATAQEFNNNGAVYFPGLSQASTGVAYVQEASATPVLQYDVASGVTLTPKKLSFGIVVTDELVMYSNFESVMRAKMGADLQLGAETIFFDATAGDDARPAGMLYGVSPETASSTTTVEGMVEDLGTICGKVSAVNGLADTIIIAGPQSAVRLWARLPVSFKLPVYASSALADTTVVALACSGVALAGSPFPPDIRLSNQGVMVMQDSAPPAITSTSASTLA
jgi:hypothetical protein